MGTLNGVHLFKIILKVIFMSLGEIFSDAIRYPFSDITKFLIIGVIAVISALSSIAIGFKVDNAPVILILTVIGLIFDIIIMGYGVDVIKGGIEHSDAIPDVDLMKNLVNGVKALIIGIVYFLIPMILIIIVAMITGAIGSGLNNVVAAFGVVGIVSIVLVVIFAIFETVAIARFADTGDWGAALSIGSVIEDVKKIGILQIIAFVILSIIIMVVASVVAGLIGSIPFVGIIIGTLLIGAFVTLFFNRALGLLYSQI